MLSALFLGFSSGLPFLLVGQTLKALLTDSGISLATIGFFTAVKLPWAWKFVWAPFVDRYKFFGLGRRRSWLFLTQFGLAISLFVVSFIDPRTDLKLLAAVSVVIALFSATQDTVVDAFIRETVPDEEMGFASALYVNGYRVAMLLAGGGALYFAQHLSWQMSYCIMAASVAVGVFTTLFSSEPKLETKPPSSLLRVYIDALAEFFLRKDAFIVLAIMLLYKLGEGMASDMLTPFYLKHGYSKDEIFAVAKLVGFWATIIGGTVGGILMIRIKIYRAMLYFGILQAAAIFLFCWLAMSERNLFLLGFCVGGEMFTSAMATAAFSTFLFLQSNRKFSATQLSLFSSAYNNTGLLFGSLSGILAESLGWVAFFVTCAAITIPGLTILFFFRNSEIQKHE